MASLISELASFLSVAAGGPPGNFTIPTPTSGTALTVAGDTTTNSMNTGQLAGFRNRIINGDMRIDQRNAGAAITPTGSGIYTVDRWVEALSQSSKLTYQQVSTSPPPGFKYSMQITVASSYTSISTDYFGFYQNIEGQNVIDLGFGTTTPATITLSFWVKGSVPGTYGLRLLNGAGNRCYVATYPVTTSWVKQSITFTADNTGTWTTDNTAGVQVLFDLGAGTSFQTTAGSWQTGNFFTTNAATKFVSQANSSTLNIAGVQLELGTVATPFEQRLISTELATCQRYFWYPDAGMPTNGTSATTLGSNCDFEYCGVAHASGGGGPVTVTFPVSMRVVPTITFYGNNTGQWYQTGALNVYGTMTLTATTPNYISINGPSIPTAYQAVIRLGGFTASAEL